MKTVALVSAYREGALVQAAVASGLAATGHVVVFEGPTGPPHERGLPSDYSPFRRDPHVVIREGSWDSDAGKRTAMVEYAHRWSDHAPVWGIWIDGDEVLLWPELLRDTLVKAHELHPDAVAVTLKIVEYDGTVADCGAKIIRLDLVEAILESSYQVKCFGVDAVLSLPNQPAEVAPLPGQPHLLHRSLLRPAGRDQDRLHLREPDWFDDHDPLRLAKVTDGAEA